MALFRNLFQKNKPKTSEVPEFLSKDFSTICTSLWEGYSLEELRGSFGDKAVDEFEAFLIYNNFSCNEALAIYQYSISSNIMLGLARQTSTKEEIKNSIFNGLVDRIKDYVPDHLREDITKDTLEFLRGLDASKSYKELKPILDSASKKIGVPTLFLYTSAMELMRLEKASEATKELQSSLSKHSLKEDTILYRAINAFYLGDILNKVGGMENLVGKTIANSSATSTTYDRSAGFVKRKDMDVVFEMFAPEGTKGLNIENLSGYSCEKEVLLKEHNLEITDVQKVPVKNNNGETSEKWYISCKVKPFDREKAFAIDGKINIPSVKTDDVVKDNIILE